MKPFNLEAAKNGDPIVTRDGRSATLIAHASEMGVYCRVIFSVEGSEYPFSSSENGRCSAFALVNSDLFMAPKKRTVWVNLYGGESPDGAAWYETEELADKHASPGRFGKKAWPLEIEE